MTSAPIAHLLRLLTVDASSTLNTLEDYLDRSTIPEAQELWVFLETHKAELVKVIPSSHIFLFTLAIER